MMAFDQVFPEVARNEARAFQAFERDGTPSTYLFREFYCTEPGCDCRRVIVHVIWVEQRVVAASIGYGFERSRRRDEPQVELDPMNPQGPRAEALLGMFISVIGKDAEYRVWLQRHYAMMKAAVDDPRHPAHRVVRGAAHDDPSFRPAFPPRKARAKSGATGGSAKGSGTKASGTTSSAATGSAETGSAATGSAATGSNATGSNANRSAATGSAATPTSEAAPDSNAAAGRRATRGAGGGGVHVALVAAKGAAGEGKMQQRFRKLLAKVDGLRLKVRAWKDERPAILREMAALEAARARHEDAMREMVLLLDRMSGAAELAKVDRRHIGELICPLIVELVDAGGHDDLKAVYARHGGGDFEAEARAAEAASAEALRTMLETLGVDIGDADGGSLDDLKARAEAYVRAGDAAEAAAARRGPRKKSARQVAAEAAREDERRRTHKAMQDVYRGLARALHPDREQDPAERARKTALMREVNVAYEAKDLLRLLELELTLEGVDGARVDSVAEERLTHYNQILTEQARQLAVELDELEGPFRLAAGPGPARLSPSRATASIAADRQEVEGHTADLRHDLELVADVRQLKAWLKSQRRRERAAAELDEFRW